MESTTPRGRTARRRLLFVLLGFAQFQCVLLSAAEPEALPTGALPTGASQQYADTLATAFHAAANEVRGSVVAVVNLVDAKGGGSIKFSLAELLAESNLSGGPLELPLGSKVINGSGILLAASGTVLTTRHVVAEPGEVFVCLADNRRFRALEILEDAQTDLAVIRFAAPPGLRAARLGDSEAIQVGDWVLAVGHPFGLKNSVTAGIISAHDRTLSGQPNESYLQSDAAINPGNSGGPLVNLRGEVIGVNTAISTQSGGFQGAGFAMPIHHAKWVADQLLAHGRVVRSYLGVSIQPNTDELAEQFGLSTSAGVVVTDVHVGSPGADAGVQRGDVIIQYDGRPIDGVAVLRGLVERTPAGDVRPLVLLRDAATLELPVVPREVRVAAAVSGAAQRGALVRPAAHSSGFGLAARAMRRDDVLRLGLASVQGVIVDSVAPGSPAQLAGLKPGMAVLEIDRQAIDALEQFEQALRAGLARGTALILLRSEQRNSYVVLRPGEY